MSIISIECPNCGANVNRKENEYFATCPFCGSEVAFNELKEEAAAGDYIDRINELEEEKDNDEKIRLKLKNWYNMRNGLFAIVGLFHWIGFSIVGSHLNDRDDTVVGIGVIFCMISWICFLFSPALLAAIYPAYNVLTGKHETGGKFKMYFVLAGIELALIVLGTVLAYIVVETIM